jgi:hypothetical protein
MTASEAMDKKNRAEWIKKTWFYRKLRPFKPVVEFIWFFLEVFNIV